MRREGNMESPFELPDDDSSGFSDQAPPSSRSSMSSAPHLDALPAPIPVPDPVITGQRASRHHDRLSARRERREARMVPQGGRHRYRTESPELEAVGGGSVCTASALSYYPPSMAVPSNSSLPSSYDRAPPPCYIPMDGPLINIYPEILDDAPHSLVPSDEEILRLDSEGQEVEGMVEAMVEDMAGEDGNHS